MKNSVGYDQNAESHTAEMEKKIENIRKGVEEGLRDTAWAFARMKDLIAEREELTASR